LKPNRSWKQKNVQKKKMRLTNKQLKLLHNSKKNKKMPRKNN